MPDGPLIVVLNHPSWWDPLVGLVLAELIPDRADFRHERECAGAIESSSDWECSASSRKPCEEVEFLRTSLLNPHSTVDLLWIRLKADLPTSANARHAFKTEWVISHMA